MPPTTSGVSTICGVEMLARPAPPPFQCAATCFTCASSEYVPTSPFHAVLLSSALVAGPSSAPVFFGGVTAGPIGALPAAGNNIGESGRLSSCIMVVMGVTPATGSLPKLQP